MNEKTKKRIVYSTLFFLLILFLLLLLVRCHPSESDVSVLPQNGALVSDTVSQEELQQMMDDSMTVSYTHLVHTTTDTCVLPCITGSCLNVHSMESA